jgi:uncharacterized membrane protein
MITTLLTTVSLGFHTLATIVLIGHYLLLTLVYLPVFNRRFSDKPLFDLLAEINDAVRQRIYAALGVFAITGIYLMLVNESYQGVGNFSNAWSMLMLVKHILVVAMIVLVMIFNSTVKSRAVGDKRLPSRLNLLSQAISVSGILVVLLTAFAQA